MKNSKRNTRSTRGLGDRIENFTKKTGIKKVTEQIFNTLGVDCGCEERKEKLNKMFPGKRPECLTEEEHRYLKEFFKENPNRIIPKVQSELLTIYNRVFHQKKKPSNCGSCFREVIQGLTKVYENYS